MKLLGNCGLLKDIKFILQISEWFGGLAFTWNKRLNQLERQNKQRRSILG